MDVSPCTGDPPHRPTCPKNDTIRRGGTKCCWHMYVCAAPANNRWTTNTSNRYQRANTTATCMIFFGGASQHQCCPQGRAYPQSFSISPLLLRSSHTPTTISVAFCFTLESPYLFAHHLSNVSQTLVMLRSHSETLGVDSNAGAASASLDSRRLLSPSNEALDRAACPCLNPRRGHNCIERRFAELTPWRESPPTSMMEMERVRSLASSLPVSASDVTAEVSNGGAHLRENVARAVDMTGVGEGWNE